MEKTRTGIVIGGQLNLREQPTTQSKSLALIHDGTRVTVSDYDAQWYSAQYNGFDGYVMKQFVQLMPALPDAWAYGKVTADPLNVRRRPSTSAARWNGSWPKGRIALIKPCVAGWYETRYRGEAAYVSAQHVLPLAVDVSDSLVDRMQYMAAAEIGRSDSRYFNGYTGAWCHRFADWLTMHAGLPKDRIPNTSGCGKGIVWFVTDAKSGGFFFKNADHKKRMMHKYAALNGLDSSLTVAEREYVPRPGDYVYFRWRNATRTVAVSHVGIVVDVEDGLIVTVEGNASGKVGERIYDLGDPRIVGYGKPIYATTESKS